MLGQLCKGEYRGRVQVLQGRVSGELLSNKTTTHFLVNKPTATRSPTSPRRQRTHCQRKDTTVTRGPAFVIDMSGVVPAFDLSVRTFEEAAQVI